MPKRVSNYILVFLLLFGTALCTVQPVGAWFCEGKQCGITLWACCCAAPSTFQDNNCRTPASDTSADSGPVICAADCGCTMVITGAPDCDHMSPPAASAFEPFAAVAITPTPVATYIPPVSIKTGSQRIEGRGPPSPRSAHACPGLRAPPAA